MAHSKLETMKAYVNSDIQQIKREQGIDVSSEVGKVLRSFITAPKRNPFSLFSDYIDIASGLRRYLSKKYDIELLPLNDTMKAGSYICEALKENNREMLREMRDYFEELITRRMSVGVF